MGRITSPAQSLFASNRGKESSASRRLQIQQAVQQFEGILWDQLAQAMTAVRLGPSNLGYAGRAYQRMLWRKVSSHDFNGSDQALTRSTLAQLLPQQASPAAAHALRSTAIDRAHTAHRATNHINPEQWVREIWHAITAGAKALKVPAKALLAQAALETGWGQRAQGNNLFGIKAHGGGASFKALTHEFTNGVYRPVEASFEGYRSVVHAVDDLVSVVKNAHPGAVGQSTVSGFAQALQRSGYATDPRYAAKIEAIAQSSRMQQVLGAVKKSASAANEAHIGTD